jgi:beta-glucosidase
MSEFATNTPEIAVPQGFPPGFVWGSATASYQVEGAVDADGRTPSIWDTFARTPGKVLGGDTGDVACDQYHQYPADIAVMKQIGLQAYRFSTAWPRIQPGGKGPVSRSGLDYYNRLVDALLDAGITPLVTVYHWDLPQELEDAGGWPARDTAHRFAEFAGIVATELGDRVPMFTTLNEPWCSAYLGYGNGVHAPGRTERLAPVRAVHHLLLGHGLASRVIREAAPNAQVSITLNPTVVRPANYFTNGGNGDIGNNDGTIDAVRRVDGITNRIFHGPLFDGVYPADVVADLADITDFSFVEPGDLERIKAPIEFLGINYYQPTYVADPSSGEFADAPSLGGAFPGSEDVKVIQPPGKRTGQDWTIDPSGLSELLLRFHSEYPSLPLVVTENGSAWPDAVSEDGRVHDADRTEFMAGHLNAVLDAVAGGADVRGYFAWSLLDNYEWAYGYSQRFGIVWVDFESQERIVKDSGRFFGRVITQAGGAADTPGK